MGKNAGKSRKTWKNTHDTDGPGRSVRRDEHKRNRRQNRRIEMNYHELVEDELGEVPGESLYDLLDDEDLEEGVFIGH